MGLFHFRTSRGRSLKKHKKSVIFMFSSSSTRVTFKPQELPFIRERSLGRSWFGFGQQRREREREKQKILSILLEYPNCTCLSTSTSLTHRPFALAKTTLRPLSVSFLGRGPEERLAQRFTSLHTRRQQRYSWCVYRFNDILAEVSNKDH